MHRGKYHLPAEDKVEPAPGALGFRARAAALLLALCAALFFLPAPAAGVLMDEGGTEKRLGDLPALIGQKALRVVVAYDQVGFYFNKGRPDGLYVALFQKFGDFLASLDAEAKNLRIYFIPVRQDQAVKYVMDGYGDIAVGLQATPDLKRYVDVTVPEKLWIKEIAVTGRNQPPIRDIRDFSGRYFTIRKSSDYAESLNNLNTYLKAMNLPPAVAVYADEYVTDADLVDMVDRGEIKGTITSNAKLVVWKRLFGNVNFAADVPIRVNGTLVWAVRHDSPELYRTINLFLRKFRDGTPQGTPVYDRYMRTAPAYESRYAKRKHWLGITPDSLKRFIRIFRKYGAKYDIDWKLLMAQAYQESTLNPAAVSKRGAVGIMQVLPRTARERYINLNSVTDLDNNVHAGTKYMRYMIDSYFSDESISGSDRLLFALASYNSGPARIMRFRKEARLEGLDPDVWFNNVEKIAARHDAVETVRYVRKVSQFYVSYSKSYELHNREAKPRAEEAPAERPAPAAG